MDYLWAILHSDAIIIVKIYTRDLGCGLEAEGCMSLLIEVCVPSGGFVENKDPVGCRNERVVCVCVCACV